MESLAKSQWEIAWEKGENTAFEYLYEYAVPTVVRYLRKYLTQESEVQDIVLKGMEVMLEKMRSGSLVVHKTVEAYFMNVCIFLLRKHWEALKKKELLMDEDSLAKSTEQWEVDMAESLRSLALSKARMDDVELVLDKLGLQGGDCQKLITAYYLEGVPQAELAELHQMTYENIRQKLSRCMKKLRELLQVLKNKQQK